MFCLVTTTCNCYFSLTDVFFLQNFETVCEKSCNLVLCFGLKWFTMVHVLKHVSSGNSVRMRPGSCSTMGIAFSRISLPNDPWCCNWLTVAYDQHILSRYSAPHFVSGHTVRSVAFVLRNVSINPIYPIINSL